MRVGPRPEVVPRPRQVKGRTRAYALDSRLFDWKPKAEGFYGRARPLGEGSQQRAFIAYLRGESAQVGKIPKELFSTDSAAPGGRGLTAQARQAAIARARVTVLLMNVLRQEPGLRDFIPEAACSRGGVIWMKDCGKDQFEDVFHLLPAWDKQRMELARTAQAVLDREFPELEGEVRIDTNWENFRYGGRGVTSWFDPIRFLRVGPGVLALGEQLAPPGAQPTGP